MRRGTETFFQVPHRVIQALNRGELTFPQFGLLCFLTGATDYRTREAVFSLRALQDGCRWDRGSDWLRKNLIELRELGWIQYDSRAGQQRPYVIRLRRAAVDGATAVSTTSDQISVPEDTPGTEITSDAVEGAAVPASRGERPAGIARPQSGPAALEETRLDDDDDELQRLLEPLGPLTVAQRRTLAQAFARAPEGFRRCASSARDGRQPAGLLLSLIAEGEHLRLNRSDEGGWLVDVLIRHPTDPDADDLQVLGPYGSRREAEREAGKHEGATVRREGRP
jgi:hypothetical protein